MQTFSSSPLSNDKDIDQQLVLKGTNVTPHLIAESMRYSEAPEPASGAKVQLFLYNNSSKSLSITNQTSVQFAGKSAQELLEENIWSWHDTPSVRNDLDLLDSDQMTVWTFNSKHPTFGPNAELDMKIGPTNEPWLSGNLSLKPSKCWMSSVTFLAPEGEIHPENLVIHMANTSEQDISISSCRLWLANEPSTPRILSLQKILEPIKLFNDQEVIPASELGGFMIKTDPLPLTYAAIEIIITPTDGPSYSIWSYLRIKVERFDISGGWVNDSGNHLPNENFLKTLKRLYVNTSHNSIMDGYSDTDLYEKYPLKYFGGLQPFEVYDTDEMLPKIHAVEFLGEPQYGGGTPVPPQDVWEALSPYAVTRLATTLTHSEERIWRDYAGLSDYPHYDAYRVSAPSPDSWRKYDRWNGNIIGWGSPLETIGDMCRSLKELNRPMPCAIWSQGPHHNWSVYDHRTRTSPTPTEIRMQAYHAISTRITSLYWFNLSLKSLCSWRDTMEELVHIGRELRLIDEFLLEGDAYEHKRLTDTNGHLDWDISSIFGPRAGILFAMDLNYEPDLEERVFKYGPPRNAQWSFSLPTYLQKVSDVFRIDADGVYDLDWNLVDNSIEISNQASQVMVYIATEDPKLRFKLEVKRQQLLEEESRIGFDPVKNDVDFHTLQEVLGSAD